VYVRRLRVKLERAVPEWQFIHTHFGLGYRMSPELSRRPQMDEPKGPDPSGLASRSRRTK
jgi:hypothetical protein